ncbi:hypothetical protein A5740_16285 [Mycobacterium sp. GA-1841]|uniref:hypothetical protein n=1 Tax=Mycobacterium sp. GA-1841 TaxID=1834154 RepID=UPI00096C597C|nr:hypothetical protein [Mycobacterium sp. GA-1841]OMC30577.1 hypothetical protein A5740_16285 [Mycobacterium sp. GA-1841]
MHWRSNVRTDEYAGAREQLGWFGMLFAMGLVFHFSDSQPQAALPVLLAALPALIFFGSVASAGLALIAGAGMAVLSLPAASNHLVMSLLVALVLGGAAVWALADRSAPSGPDGFVDRWLQSARSPVCLVLLVVYLFTVFDKLNTAYFTPATSCGGELFSQLLWINGVDGVMPGPVVGQFVAVSTVVIEAALLVLLAVPRWRYRGVLLGVGFHSVLALASFYDFATVVFAVYVLLVPTEAFAVDGQPRRTLRRVALTGFAAHVLLSVVSSAAESPDSPIGLPWHTLLVLTWAVAVGPGMYAVVQRYRAVPVATTESRRLPLVVLLLVPLLAFVNGLTPYLGLKTVANYSMFSNLRTEDGTTNHLLPGMGALELVGYQRDTVTVVGLRLPDRTDDLTYLRRQARWVSEDPPVRIPWLELRRSVLLWRDAGLDGIGLAYVRDGVSHMADDAVSDAALAAPLPWWQRHLLAFRAVDSGWGAEACRW